MSRCNEQHVPRQVIEDRLLMALDDKDKVALVLSEDDLGMLITAVERMNRYELSPASANKAFQMERDLRQLRKAAFSK